MPNGQTLVDWIRATVLVEANQYDIEMPSREQMALVISALRMHAVIEYAANYDKSELGKPDEITEYWPIESSIGRYFRDAARETIDSRKEAL
jgi:hypothetical protein